MSPENQHLPPRALPRGTRYALADSTLGTGMVYLDQSAVNVALPALRAGLDIAVSDLQWVMSLYVLFASAPLLVCGMLGEQLGRVRFFVAGTSLFGAASLILAGIGLIGAALTLFAATTRIDDYVTDLLPATLTFGCGLGLAAGICLVSAFLALVALRPRPEPA